MKEVTLEGLGKNVDEGTLQTWFFEEGDSVNEGDDLVELTTEEGTVTISAPASGILAEVYYDEGEVVSKGEVLCTIDGDGDEDEEDADDEDEDEDEEDEDDEDADEDDDDEEDEEDEE